MHGKREFPTAKRLLKLLVLVCVAGAVPAAGEDPAAVAARRATRALEECRARWDAATASSEAGWQLARACFDAAEFAPDKAARGRLAEEGIEAARAVIERCATNAPAHYYLALNLGRLAETKTLGALPLVREMESHLLRARELDPGFDFAGPDRTLGLLYRDAPGWPLSVGSRKKARRHLDAALDRAPGYPENRLNRLETRIQWREKEGALEDYRAMLALLPQARDRFVGPRWAWSWADWDRRWARAEVQIHAWFPETR
ncbi:MAG: hypothetical protein D6766_11345 [Verrucomicrobia bacterium]|nr:MAG: hypothetical protein D6766_11320 [Verrucomicrobiota bacterium]RME91744.1 MAG: hypothetical protein D6766_11345 [Verrucomicrobiota bacterium]